MGGLIGIANKNKDGLLSKKESMQYTDVLYPVTRMWTRISKQAGSVFSLELSYPWIGSGGSISGVDKYVISVPALNSVGAIVARLINGNKSNSFFCKEDERYLYIRQSYAAENNSLVISINYCGKDYTPVEIKNVDESLLSGKEIDVTY